MARSKIHPTTSVTFRLPDDSLQSIDELARKNSHDRTAELISACKYWVKIGGTVGTDAQLNENIQVLQEKIAVIEESMKTMSDSIKHLEESNTTLLRILEKLMAK